MSGKYIRLNVKVWRFYCNCKVIIRRKSRFQYIRAANYYLSELVALLRALFLSKAKTLPQSLLRDFQEIW